MLLLILGMLAIGGEGARALTPGGGWHARPPDAHEQSAGDGARPRRSAFPPWQGAWQRPALTPGGGWMLRHTCPPDTQHLAAWRTRGPPTAQAEEIGLHSGPRPGLKGLDHVQVPCAVSFSFLLLPRPDHTRVAGDLLPVDNKLAYTVVHGMCGGGGGGTGGGGGGCAAAAGRRAVAWWAVGQSRHGVNFPLAPPASAPVRLTLTLTLTLTRRGHFYRGVFLSQTNKCFRNE